MEPSSFTNTRAFREWRRLHAWELFQSGWNQKSIAVAFRVTQGAVSQWIKRGKEQGIAGLRLRNAPGAPPKLSPEQKSQLPVLLQRGAEAFGFSGEAWTCERIAAVILREFGVTYSPNYIRVLLHQIGWSYQTPTLKATQRKAEAIAEWQETRLPALKKGQTRAGTNSCS